MSAPIPPPISEDLWNRLRQFDPHCYMSLARSHPDRPGIVEQPRVWRATIHPHSARLDAVHGQDADLTECLRLTVEAAERSGWAKVSTGVRAAPPISGELWQRMKALDSTCYVHVWREEPCLYHWRKMSRTWHILIADRRAMAHDSVSAEHPMLAEALRMAVEEAERKGWADPNAVQCPDCRQLRGMRTIKSPFGEVLGIGCRCDGAL